MQLRGKLKASWLCCQLHSTGSIGALVLMVSQVYVFIHLTARSDLANAILEDDAAQGVTIKSLNPNFAMEGPRSVSSRSPPLP